jgi:hypothetical protein
MRYRKEYMGLDGFYWWFGVVENRKDPMNLGRCQVRIFGVHTENLSLIPSEDLPWAMPVHAINSPAFSTPKEGDYVFGFFIDGKFAQSPMMLGIVPGIPTQVADTTIGFNDLRTTDEISESPKKPANIQFNYDGSGVEITETEDLEAERHPRANELNKPSIAEPAYSALSDNSVIKAKKTSTISVETAEGIVWDEPVTSFSPLYPYNKAMETESGHVIEYDDTPGFERIHQAHRSGTFSEVFPSGTKVEKIVKNNYKIVLSDDHIMITGRAKITIGSDAYVRVVGDAFIQAENNLNVGVAGSANFSVGGDFTVKAEGDINLAAQGSINNLATNIFGLADGVIGLDGSAVSLNSGVAEGITVPDINPPPPTGTPTDAPEFIEQSPADRAGFIYDAGEAGSQDYIAEQVQNGVISQEDLDNTADINENSDQFSTESSPNLAPTTISCGGVELSSNITPSMMLSDNYSLAQLSSRAPCGDAVIAQRNLSVGDIVCNLKLLAINCLEPIKAKYPNVLVTNAFRKKKSDTSRSQHEVGQAADLQFPGIDAADYYDIAVWIRDNVPHDQLLLEYKTYGSKLPWIHISFNKEGNRPSSASYKNATFLNNKPYKPYLINLK